jgi:hypothetical protein
MKSNEETIMKSTIFALAFFSLTLPAFGQGVDHLVGTWKLNVEKSTYVGNQPPKSQTNTFSGEGQQFIDTVEGVNAQGQAVKVVFQHIYDGMPHATPGSPDRGSVAYTRSGDTINFTRFKNVKTAQVGQLLIVSGKTFPLVTGGITSDNQPFYNLGAYDRQ